MRIGPAGQIDHLIALNAAGARVDRIRPNGGQVINFERENFTGFGGCQSRLDAMLASMDVGQKRFHPVRIKLDRTTQHD